jgi:hypothetical protein
MNTTTTATKIKISHDHLMQSVKFYATIIGYRIADRAILVRIPTKVRNLPFPPFGGKSRTWLKPEAIRSAF